jgi:hypothetical protein
MKECDRIREEKKMDRLAVVREKKRKYGIKRISKEENMRLKKRTEERFEVASAKENLWRKFRDKNKDLAPTGEEAEAWEGLRASVMELEENVIWRETGEEAAHLHQLRIRVRIERLGPGGQVQMGEEGHGGAEESKNVDREGLSRERGEQQDGHGQGGVQVRANRDGDEGGREKRVAVVAHGHVHGQDREGGLGHKGLPGLHLYGQVQEEATAHGGAGIEKNICSARDPGGTQGRRQGGQVHGGETENYRNETPKFGNIYYPKQQTHI